jgi:hypothetical protein
MLKTGFLVSLLITTAAIGGCASPTEDDAASATSNLNEVENASRRTTSTAEVEKAAVAVAAALDVVIIEIEREVMAIKDHEFDRQLTTDEVAKVLSLRAETTALRDQLQELNFAGLNYLQSARANPKDDAAARTYSARVGKATKGFVQLLEARRTAPQYAGPIAGLMKSLEQLKQTLSPSSDPSKRAPYQE